ncbi:GNAT family N-acetyltransferase [Paenibacillus pinihumi]|uniref:GNAT family N-acetyltransferase n=1 Tax=Paenibacillus pinihumi TaxID=669462 RepID=UPI0003F77EAD|nr:GNAT family N-acetyltransferase [Paenibacillus pinihumi]
MIHIVELNQRMDLFDAAVRMVWEQWGSETNYNFYYDCMKNSCDTASELPRFYIALQEDKTIVGTYALLTNDLISRQDLFPWFACLYVIPECRGNRLGALLLQHALDETAKKGYQNLYLSTDLDDYYEKYGWNYLNEGYIFNGDLTKIYVHPTNAL